jgi:hypothetical protein
MFCQMRLYCWYPCRVQGAVRKAAAAAAAAVAAASLLCVLLCSYWDIFNMFAQGVLGAAAVNAATGSAAALQKSGELFNAPQEVRSVLPVARQVTDQQRQ